ncbi:MAG: FHA domain-containing protein [Planctomycetes bacterium]|nr:FHA domain-containing protein [Planctomycetota bacterium]
MPELAFRIVEPGGSPREVAITSGMTLGRSSENDCPLADPKSSSRHARVFEEDGQWFVEDVGSSNHTLILNGPILKSGDRHPLGAGTALQIGDSKLIVIVEGAVAVAGGGAAGKTIAAKISFGTDDDSSSELTGGEGKMGSLAELAAFKTARPRLVLCNEAIRRIVDIDVVRWLVGRADGTANCVIDHPAVSTSHAQIVYSDRRFLLEDLGSRNGSFVDGERVAVNSRIPLQPESLIRFGSIEAIFVVDSDRDGRQPDPKRYTNALEYLVSVGHISRLQREEAERDARAEQRHAGEKLLEKGYIRADQWVEALKKGEVIVINRNAGGGGNGLRNLLLLVVLLLILLILVVVVNPDVLKNLGLGGRR